MSEAIIYIGGTVVVILCLGWGLTWSISRISAKSRRGGE